ncbi:MAG: hypothetical protein FWG13_05430 [Leptospirales bacterium]|nr:hypothetical protein [Leptospirales bacterium]
MKERNKLTGIGLCGFLFFILAITLPGCFIWDDADEGTLIINTGGGTKTTTWTHTDNPWLLGQLEYQITLSGKITKTVPATGGSTKLTLPVGHYEITMDAYCGGINGGVLYAEGTKVGVDVKAGNNAVAIPMTPSDTAFYTVNNGSWHNDWGGALGMMSDGGKYCIILNCDIDVVGSINTFSAADSVTIIGNGHSISRDATGVLGFLFQVGKTSVPGTQTVAIKDVNLVGSNTASLVQVENGGAFIMNSGTISGGKASQGGGVEVKSGGEFIMNGGTISGNEASNIGGGVYLVGSFTMNGGTISDNTASGNGGGVLVAGGGEFTMNGGTISGNTADNGSGMGNGGGVSCSLSSAFIMNSGRITGNEANQGGGVYVSGGAFTMKGGTIYGNTAIATDGGAALYFNTSAGTVTIGGKPYTFGGYDTIP